MFSASYDEKNQLEVLILKPRIECLHCFATLSLRSMKDVSNREGLDSTNLYQEEALIKKKGDEKCVFFLLRCWSSSAFYRLIYSLMLQILR